MFRLLIITCILNYYCKVQHFIPNYFFRNFLIFRVKAASVQLNFMENQAKSNVKWNVVSPSSEKRF